jgi:hypothetical protein
MTFVSPASWLGPHEPADPGTAIDALVRAHLDAYGPADPEEFSRWFGRRGWISPVLVVDGRIAGIWTGDRRGDTLSITIEPFEPLARSVPAELAGAANRVAVASGATGADLVVAADPI